MSDHRPDPVAAVAAATGGTGLAVAGVLVLTQGPFKGELATTAEYATDVAFAVALVGLAVGLLALAPRIDAPRHAVRAAVAGQALILVGVLAGLASGRDVAWFEVIAGPGLLLWLVGTAWMGVRAYRARRLPRAVAVLLALTVPLAVLPFGEVGGGVVIGALWIWIAARVLHPAAHAARPVYAEAG